MSVLVRFCLLCGFALLAACSSESGPYLAVGGGGFVFNYRIADATAGIVVFPKRTLPEGGRIVVTFDNPAGGPPFVMSQPVEKGLQRYDFTTPSLTGVKAKVEYKMVIVLYDADGKELEKIEKPLVSELDQTVLPDKPLTIGPGYARNPEGEAAKPTEPAN